MRIKKIVSAVLMTSIMSLTSCGGSFQQPQYTVRTETDAVTEATNGDTDMGTDWLEKLTEKGMVFIPFGETSEDCRIKEDDYKYKGSHK